MQLVGICCGSIVPAVVLEDEMMDTKEALKELEDLTVDYGNRNEEQIARLDEAIDMAMDALRAQAERTEERTETHGVCLDAIDRQAVIDTVRKIILGFFSDEDGVMNDTEKTLLSVNKAVCNGVRELPSTQPEVLACGEGELIAQPEIVRCKDCMYWVAHDKRCVYLNHGFAPNMWCCHGRRTDD